MVAKATPVQLGQVFGRLTVSGQAPERKGKYLYVQVSCVCGTVKLIEQTNLRKGKVTSCGCLNRELIKTRSVTHGMRGKPIYAVWNAMVQRTCNPKDKGYPNYGGRGVTLDPNWKVFENFLKDMGEPPFEGASLDREDNELGYCKTNCRWVTRTEQNRNKRNNVHYTYKGENLTLQELADKYSLNVATLRSRVYLYGFSIEEAIEKPLQFTGEPT